MELKKGGRKEEMWEGRKEVSKQGWKKGRKEGRKEALHRRKSHKIHKISAAESSSITPSHFDRGEEDG